MTLRKSSIHYYYEKLFLLLSPLLALFCGNANATTLLAEQESFKKALEDFQAKKTNYESVVAAPNFARECPNMPDLDPQGGNTARHVSMQIWFREFEKHGKRYQEQLEKSATALNLVLGKPVDTREADACTRSFEILTKELNTSGKSIEQERDLLEKIQRAMSRDLKQSIHANHPTSRKALCSEYAQKREQARIAAVNLHKKMKKPVDYLNAAALGLHGEITKLNAAKVACSGGRKTNSFLRLSQFRAGAAADIHVS